VRPLRVLRPGRLSYDEGLALQARLVVEVRSGRAPETLILLEHPPVITLGSGARPEHVLADEAQRARLGISLHQAGRGGDVTYHGPGQLIGYPILDLKPDRQDLHRYLRDLEGVLIETLAGFDIAARRSPGQTGVWTDRGKIAAIGVRVSSGWITSHGFALNVEPDLAMFETIVPCGIHDEAVTSMALELGAAPPPDRVEEAVVEAVAGTFSRAPMRGTVS
jgi:lipoate-protein ligase B